MKTIETIVYEFDELLTEKAKEKAREWYRRCQDGDNYFSESVIEDAEQCAELMGITFKKRGQRQTEPCVFWSGFSSQGDGACFEGQWYASSVKPGGMAEHVGDSDSCKELKRISAEFERIAKEFPQAGFSVSHRGHYPHSNCTEFNLDVVPDYEDVPDPADEKRMVQAGQDLVQAARDFMDWIYSQLEKEYEYRNADEQVDESIRANSYTFTKDGKRF